MRQACNADARVHFAYDPLSRLVEEVQEHLAPDGAGTLGRYAWRHAYDALGNRTDSRMPGGRHVQWLYYGSGHLHQIRVDGHVLSDIERDALHQEIERTQGALESRYGWDPMGRLVAHKVGRRQALQGQPGMASPQALRDRDQGLPAVPQLPSGDRIARHYRYDPTGNLIATRDGLRGDSHYRYDPLGRILAAQRGDGTPQPQQPTEREAFAFDPAGNLLNPNRGGAQSSGGVGQRDVVPYNRLAVYQDLRFTYDLHGNTIERRIGWHTVQHYRYSPEHQIVEARVVRYRERPAEGQAQKAWIARAAPSGPSRSHPLLAQLARERAAVHAQPAGGLGDVEVGLGQHFVDALPFERLDGAGAVGQLDFRVAFGEAEGGLDVVGVRGLGEVVAGAELHGLDRSGDAGEARQHHDAHLGIAGVQLLHAGQSGRLSLELQVDHGVVRIVRFEQRLHARQAVGLQHAVAAALEGARERPGEGFVVFHDQQQAFIVHGVRVRWRAARSPTGAGGW